MPSVKLTPSQNKAVSKLGKGKILAGGVGSGKSLTALFHFYTKVLGGVFEYEGDIRPAPSRTIDLYIITTAKKRDSLEWNEDLAKLGFSPNDPDGIQQFTMTVDSWNNIKKYEGVKNAWFIFDEQRVGGNGTWVRSFLRITKNNGWILLSATPGDTWVDYIPVFLANGFYPNRTAFNRRHIVFSTWQGYPKIERFLEEDRLRRLRRHLLVEINYHKHTTRHDEIIFVDYDKDALNRIVKDRWNIFTGYPIETASEMFQAVKTLTGSDEARLLVVGDLLEKHPRLIVFYNYNPELEQLRRLGDLYDIPVAEWNGHKHQPIPDTERWVYLVQYLAGAEGWNCTETNSMLFYTPTYSYKQLEQAKGRIDRWNTKYVDLYYYHIFTKTFLDRGIRRAQKEKRNFNESAWINRYQKTMF